MKKRTVISVIAVLALLISICSCAFADKLSADGVSAQTDLLYAYLKALNVETAEQHYLYTVTDLDGNGRLELIAACEIENEYVTYGVIVEADEGFETATVVELAEGMRMPEVLVSQTQAYQAAEGMNYVFADAEEGGSTLYAVQLKEGKLSEKKIAEITTEVVNGYAASTYKNAAGEILDPNGYEKAPESFFSGVEKTAVKLDWFTHAEAASAQRLTDSYAVFTGEKEQAEGADEKIAAEKAKNLLSPTPKAPEAEAAAPETAASPEAAAPEAAAPEGAEGGIVIVDANGNPTGQSVDDVLSGNLNQAGAKKDEGKGEEAMQIVTIDPDKQNAKTGDGNTTVDGYKIYDSIEEARAAIGNSNYSPKNSGKSNNNGNNNNNNNQKREDPVTPDPIIIYDGGSAGSGDFSGGTGTALCIFGDYSSRIINDSQVQVTLTATLNHSTLTSRSTGVSYWLSGYGTGSSSAPAIDSAGGSTYLGSYTFTVNLAPGQSTALDCSVSWTFNGTYSGNYIDAVTAYGTVYLSR